MKIALVSDAWHPQINGVVRTLDTLCRELSRRGHETALLTPQGRFSVPCPSYPEIRLAVASRRTVDSFLDRAAPDAIHIATEGPLGIAVRRRCLARGLSFSTAWHTRFPDYVALRTGLPEAWFYPLMRHFHAPSSAVMVATASLMEELGARGFRNLRRWSRGVDTGLFRPALTPPVQRQRPVALYVGRVAVEKNIEAFLDLEAPLDKVVVGDGPALAGLRRRYPETRFLGAQGGEPLAQLYRDADVFVFPSRTDVRARHARGAGLGGAGRRFSGARSARCDRARRARHGAGIRAPRRLSRRGSRARCRGRTELSRRGLSRLCRALRLGRLHATIPRQSGTPCSGSPRRLNLFRALSRTMFRRSQSFSCCRPRGGRGRIARCP